MLVHSNPPNWVRRIICPGVPPRTGASPGGQVWPGGQIMQTPAAWDGAAAKRSVAKLKLLTLVKTPIFVAPCGKSFPRWEATRLGSWSRAVAALRVLASPPAVGVGNLLGVVDGFIFSSFLLQKQLRTRAVGHFVDSLITIPWPCGQRTPDHIKKAGGLVSLCLAYKGELQNSAPAKVLAFIQNKGLGVL